LKVAGVVVLYNPVDSFLENIRSYVDQVEMLFVIDNSETARADFVDEVKKFCNVTYRWMGGNAGIAAALNAGAELAITGQCDYVLLMDQDSSVPGNMVPVFKEFALNSKKNIGILYAHHVYHNYPQPEEKDTVKEILTADTAGSFLNLSAYKKIGGFINELFIDYVDFEYCLRLRKNGFEIVQLNTVSLHQRLGNMSSGRLLFWKVGLTNHPPVRVYYRVRNRLFVARKYIGTFPRWSLLQMSYTIVDLFKVVFYEHDKLAKIKMMALGVAHFFSNTYGPLRHA
jgi:rhamnosyltransferase